MRNRFILAAVMGALLTGLSPSHAQTSGERGGCLARGSGPTVLDGSCEYVALDGEQQIFALTTDRWKISAIRFCAEPVDFRCQVPREEDECTVAEGNTCELKTGPNGEVLKFRTPIVLLTGEGITTPPFPTVHPIPGETIDVRILIPDDGGGSNGILWAGFQDQEHDTPAGPVSVSGLAP